MSGNTSDKNSKKNPLVELRNLGQSAWLDFIQRGIVRSGELQGMIELDGICGVTSNPSIFEKAIAESHDYDQTIQTLIVKGKDPAEIYQALSVEDIQMAADLLRPVYDETYGRDGFVSLEVSPKLARETAGTIAEARRLWMSVDRPNTMIKVPGTKEGIPAIRQLIGEGINVNVTLLFGLGRYREAAEAYISGLEILAGKGKHLSHMASVASFFLSRIDVLIDPILEKKMEAGGPQAEQAKRLHGQLAIASAKAAYQIYKEIFSSDRFASLARKGAYSQRLLWASTSTKNPAYPDTKYVEALIGPDTVNTMPIATIEAYRDHGHPERSLDQNTAEANQMLNELSAVGIDLQTVTQQLEDEGVIKFDKAFDQLMDSLEKKREAVNQDQGYKEKAHS